MKHGCASPKVRQTRDELRSENFLIVPRNLIASYGVKMALYLANLIDKHAWFDKEGALLDGCFYLTLEQQERDIGLSKDAIRECKKHAVELGIITRTFWYGMPAREYIEVDFDVIRSYLVPNGRSTQETRTAGHLVPNGRSTQETRTAGHLVPKARRYPETRTPRYPETRTPVTKENANGSNGLAMNLGRNNNKYNNNKDIFVLGSANPDNDICQKQEDQDRPTSSNKPSSARKRSEAFLPYAQKLASIVTSEKNVKIDGRRLRQWANDIRILHEVDGVSKDRIEQALDWYASHIGGQYIPVIESGGSFRLKFTRLEDAMRRERPRPIRATASGSAKKGPSALVRHPPRTPSARAQAERYFRGDKILVRGFMKGPFSAAKSLFGADGYHDKSEMAKALLDLLDYVASEQEANLKGQMRDLMPSPTEVVRLYLAWIDENRWIENKSLRILDPESGLFQRFRNDQARAEALGRDLLTGRTRAA